MGGRLTLNFPFSTLAPLKNFRLDLLRRIECVIVVYGGRCQDTPVHALYRYVLQVDMDVLALPGIYVRQRDYGFYPCESRDAEALTTGTSRLSLTFSLSQIRSIGKKVAS